MLFNTSNKFVTFPLNKIVFLYNQMLHVFLRNQMLHLIAY